MFDLKNSDLTELERLATGGFKWIARDWNEQVYAYTAKPFKNTTTWVGGAKCEKIIGLGINSQIGVQWSDSEPLNIAAAIAQIKAGKKSECLGVESAEEILNEFCAEQDKKPLTWNERINQMTVEEKAELFDSLGFCIGGFVKDEDCNAHKDCEGCALLWLTSPCEGGEKE